MGEWILGSEESFGSRAVSLAFRVLLEGVRYRNGPVAQVLAVHGFDGCIGSFETGIVDERETFRVASGRVSHDLQVQSFNSIINFEIPLVH